MIHRHILEFSVIKATAGENHGQIRVGVGIRVAHSTTKKNGGMIKHAAFAILNALQLLKKPGKLLQLIVFKSNN